MIAKKWVKLWFFVSFLNIFSIVIFNYTIDSLGLVSNNSYLNKAAKDLANGKIIAGLKNFDERIFRKKVIQNLKIQPTWVAIGSSRTMQLRKRFFLDDNQTFQNYSVSGASLEDYIALIQIHKNKFKTLPKNIILGIDPWVFNKNNNQNRYVSLIKEYNQFLKDNGLNKYTKKLNIMNKYKKLFSLQYFKENIKFVINNLKNGLKGYYIVKNVNVDDYLREPDGSIQYPFKIRYPNPNKVKKLAIKYVQPPVYGLENFKKIDNKKLFEKLISYLIKNKINIYFYLPPYNPYTYDLLISNNNYKIIIEVEKYLKDYAKKHNISVIGSYNPHIYKFTNKDFFDGMHPLDNVYKTLFHTLSKK